VIELLAKNNLCPTYRILAEAPRPKNLLLIIIKDFRKLIDSGNMTYAG
jgi:hypothetical protein